MKVKIDISKVHKNNKKNCKKERKQNSDLIGIPVCSKIETWNNNKQIISDMNIKMQQNKQERK